MNNLKDIGIKEFYYWGKTLIGRHRIIGKGHTGIVVLCGDGENIGVCKVLRTDLPRKTLAREAEIIKKLGYLGISPRLYGYSDTVVFMEYVEGFTLEEFLNTVNARNDLLQVIAELIDATYVMDALNISHGELSRPRNHVIVARWNKVRIIDYEYASMRRKPHNQSQLLSALFLSRNKLVRRLSSILGPENYLCLKKSIEGALRMKQVIYKEYFMGLVEKCFTTSGND